MAHKRFDKKYPVILSRYRAWQERKIGPIGSHLSQQIYRRELVKVTEVNCKKSCQKYGKPLFWEGITLFYHS